MDKNLTMVRGDTLSFGIEITFDDNPQSLESVYFSCKNSYSATDYAFQKSLGNGITQVSAGKYRVRVAPDDTYSLASGVYYYDLQIGLNGDTFTIMRGALELEPDVTREVVPWASI